MIPVKYVISDATNTNAVKCKFFDYSKHLLVSLFKSN